MISMAPAAPTSPLRTSRTLTWRTFWPTSRARSLQDDWRVNSKLVINLGARYDYFSHFVATPADPAAPAGLFNFNGLLDNQFHFGPFRSPLEPVNSVGCGSLC